MKKNLYLYITMAFLSVNSFAFAVSGDDVSFKKQALEFCGMGDTCVAIKSSCNTWAAVRDVYAYEAKSFFKAHAEKSDCVDYTAAVAIPVATCSLRNNRCMLTGENRYIIDPRLQVH